MMEHELVLNGDVVSIYTNGKLTSLKYNRDKVVEISSFIFDAGFTGDEVKEKLDELFLQGRTKFQDRK